MGSVTINRLKLETMELRGIKQLAHGLRGVQVGLLPNMCALFILPYAPIKINISMWRMQFPLDIIWVGKWAKDGKYRVCHLVENAQPCGFFAPQHKTPVPAFFIIEASVGTIKAAKARVGSIVKIEVDKHDEQGKN